MEPRSALDLPISPPKSSQSMIGKADDFLCPDLVVPSNREHKFRVPINPDGFFHVPNIEGNNVLRVELQIGTRERRCVVLKTSDGSVLAQCVATRGTARIDEFLLLRGSSGEYFAKLAQGGPDQLTRSSHEATWIVQTRAGTVWFFCRQVDSSVMGVMDKLGNVIAILRQDEQTEDQNNHAGESVLLQVGPQMDFSVVLLVLVAIRHLTRL